MTRVFLTLPLERLEPGPAPFSPSRAGILAAPVPFTNPTRYVVLGGHDLYWQAVREGESEVFCEITLGMR